MKRPSTSALQWQQHGSAAASAAVVRRACGPPAHACRRVCHGEASQPAPVCRLHGGVMEANARHKRRRQRLGARLAGGRLQALQLLQAAHEAAARLRARRRRARLRILEQRGSGVQCALARAACEARAAAQQVQSGLPAPAATCVRMRHGTAAAPCAVPACCSVRSSSTALTCKTRARGGRCCARPPLGAGIR